MHYFLCQLVRIILSISSKKHKKLNDNRPKQIYINETENRVTFKTETGYYSERTY